MNDLENKDSAEAIVENKEQKDKVVLTKGDLQTIGNIADRLYELKNDNCFYFSNMGYKLGDIFCAHILANCYNDGLGTEVDKDKANELYKACFDKLLKLADEGNYRAQYYIGFHYLFGYGDTEIDDEEAFDYFSKSRLQGNVLAQKMIFDFPNKIGEVKNSRWIKSKIDRYSEMAVEIENQFIESNKEDINDIDVVVELTKLANKNIPFTQALLARWYSDGTFVEKDDEKAIIWLEKAASKDLQSLIYLAKAYEEGNGTEKDLTKAFECYLKAAEQNSIESINKIGDMYYDGLGVERDYDQSFMYHERAANLGFVDAIYKLGIHYYNAEGCKKDIKKSLQYYQDAANLGYAPAEYKLGNCYNGVYGIDKNVKLSQQWLIKAAIDGSEEASHRVGIIGENCNIIDIEKATSYLKEAIENGNDFAIYVLGRAYENDGEHQDLDKALELYQTACERNVPEAFVRLGYSINGNGYQKDKSRFTYWYTRAITGTNPLAKMRLGHCYELGDGIEQSNEKALSWYDQAALVGCAPAQFMLGNFYHDHNKLVENDESKAVYYYDLAAKENHVPAQMALAECYEKGFGTEKDLKMAVFWYMKAAENKNYEAEKKLTKFKKKSDGTWVKKLF